MVEKTGESNSEEQNEQNIANLSLDENKTEIPMENIVDQRLHNLPVNPEQEELERLLEESIKKIGLSSEEKDVLR